MYALVEVPFKEELYTKEQTNLSGDTAAAFWK